MSIGRSFEEAMQKGLRMVDLAVYFDPMRVGRGLLRVSRPLEVSLSIVSTLNLTFGYQDGRKSTRLIFFCTAPSPKCSVLRLIVHHLAIVLRIVQISAKTC